MMPLSAAWSVCCDQGAERLDERDARGHERGQLARGHGPLHRRDAHGQVELEVDGLAHARRASLGEVVALSSPRSRSGRRRLRASWLGPTRMLSALTVPLVLAAGGRDTLVGVDRHGVRFLLSPVWPAQSSRSGFEVVRRFGSGWCCRLDLRGRTLFFGGAKDLGDRRDPGSTLRAPSARSVPMPLPMAVFLMVLASMVRADESPDVVVDDHHLEDAHAAAVAGDSCRPRQPSPL